MREALKGTLEKFCRELTARANVFIEGREVKLKVENADTDFTRGYTRGQVLRCGTF